MISASSTILDTGPHVLSAPYKPSHCSDTTYSLPKAASLTSAIACGHTLLKSRRDENAMKSACDLNVLVIDIKRRSCHTHISHLPGQDVLDDVQVIPVVVNNNKPRIFPYSDQLVASALNRHPGVQNAIDHHHEMPQLSAASTILAPLASSSHVIRNVPPQPLLGFQNSSYMLP